MNTAYGMPTRERLPFDLGHLRFPILFHCAEDTDDDTKKTVREELAGRLTKAIKAVLLSEASKHRRSPEKEFVPHEPKERRSRFRSKGQSIGLVDLVGHEGPPDLFLADAPAEFWLRLMPTVAHGREFTVPELRQQIRPYGHVNARPSTTLIAGELLGVRDVDGYGTWNQAPRNDGADGIAYAFTNGEIWMIEQRVLRYSANGHFIPLNVPLWARSLEMYTRFLQQLELEPPFQWIAGVVGVKGRGLNLRSQDFLSRSEHAPPTS